MLFHHEICSALCATNLNISLLQTDRAKWFDTHKMYRLIFNILPLNFDSILKTCVKITRTVPLEAFNSVIGVSVKQAVFQRNCFHRCFKLAFQENPFSDDAPHGFINLPDNTYP